MFKCEQCGRQTIVGEKQYKKVVSKRPMVYENGSSGWEIKKEISICGKCKGD